MRVTPGKMTVGDVGVRIGYTTDQTLTGDIDFELMKPDGSTIRRDADSLVDATAYYYTVEGDIDQAGDWYVFLKNVTTGYYFIEDGANVMKVRPKPATMARQ